MIEHFNKGTLLLSKGKYAKAVTEFKKSISILPSADAYLNLGTTYKFLDKDSAASDAFRKALVTPLLGKGSGNIPAMANTNLGLMKYVYEHDMEAIELFDKADALSPGYGDANWNKATALLRMACSGSHDKFALGWDQYEYRFKKTSPVTIKGTFGTLRDRTWLGQKDCRVLVCAEQGIGDNIMFSRYLLPLAQQYNLDITLQDTTGMLWNKCVGLEFNPSDYDYVLPLGSICRFIGFINPEPYIHFSDSFDLPGINIGIVWSGSTSHANDRHRSVSPQRFKRFGRYGKLWSLNPGVKCPSFASPCTISSWKDTATWLNSMDLVISVDTSIVHMAGALGIRTWMIQPFKETDFRWGSNNDKSNIWYSSVDIYRNPNDWEFVFDSLEEDLKELV